MIKYAAIFFISTASSAFADTDPMALATALGYADSATFDCEISELNDDNRLLAMQRIAESGDYATNNGVVTAYMGAFKDGQSRYRATVELGGATIQQRCDFAKNGILDLLE